MSDEGANCIAVRAGLQEGRAIHTTGSGEEDESLGGVERVYAILAGFARTTGHVAGARVGGGVESAVVEGETGSAKGIHDIWIGSVWARGKDNWLEPLRIHFDGFLEKTDR